VNPKELDEDIKQFSYKLVESNDKFKIKCSNLDKLFTPEEISAQILRKLAVDASKFLNQKVNKAVITVPAYFNDAQRQAKKYADQIWELDVLHIMNKRSTSIKNVIICHKNQISKNLVELSKLLSKIPKSFFAILTPIILLIFLIKIIIFVEKSLLGDESQTKKGCLYDACQISLKSRIVVILSYLGYFYQTTRNYNK
jgi:hypothetical protein